MKKTYFKGWISCSVSTMWSCRSEPVRHQHYPFCQQISLYCCYLALVYVMLKCSRPTSRKRREKRCLENNKTHFTRRCANSSGSEASGKSTSKNIMSYSTLCNSCHPLSQSSTWISPSIFIPPMYHCHTHLSRKKSRFTVLHAEFTSFHLLMSFPLICREWPPQHVPKESTSSESSWRSLSAESRFTVKDQGWVACQRVGPWQDCSVRPLPAAVLWTYSIGLPEGKHSHSSLHNGCQGAILRAWLARLTCLIQAAITAQKWGDSQGCVKIKVLLQK